LASETRVRDDQLREVVSGIFSALEVPESEEIADHLVLANLRGVDSHGVSRVGIYAERLELGLVSKVTRMEILRETPVSALVDGGNGSGIVVASRAMDLAVEKAQDSGIGVVCVRRSNHCGMLAAYTQRATQRGLISLVTTSAPANMAPWGGTERFFGTNPLSYGVPGGEEIDVIFDMATSNVSRGKIILAAKNGQKIPLGWAIDRDGRETTDSEAALDGLVLPLGGAKGSGLAFFVEVLSSILPGANFGPHIPPLYDDFDREQGVGHFFLALRPDLFVSLEEFTGGIDRMIRELREVGVAEGHEKIYLPGEIELEKEKERCKEGIPLSQEVLRELKTISGRYKTPFGL
jgi:ureidoglycolate dehydrogenase (NAD+)